MDQIGNKEGNPPEETSHSSSPTHFSSDFDSQSASSAQASSSSQLGVSSELKAMDGANPSDDGSISEELTEADFLLEKIQIPEILRLIFGMLDKGSLRKAREVSTKWNETALQILSKVPGRVEFIVEKDGIGEKGLARLQKLHSILNVTKHPGMFFTQLALKPVKKGVFGPEKVQLLTLLQSFGSNLKSLEFQRSVHLHLSILRPLLEDWCVQLEELTLIDITIIEDSNTTVQSFEEFPSPLNLKLRKIRISDSCTAGPARNWMVSVIKSSPNLQALEVFVQYKEADFWRKVSSLPSITKNLQKVQIGTWCLADLSWLKDVCFSNKLKSLTLYLGEPSFPKEQLFEFLETVVASLDEFCLIFDNELSWSDDDDSYWKLELPLMSNLKMLEHYISYERCFDSIDLLKMCPNLEILRLAASKNGNSMLVRVVDALFLNSSYLVMHPHTKLNSLSLKGSPRSLETIPAMNRMFPNLHELSIHLDGVERPESTDETSWFIANSKAFSEMKNLNVLKVYFKQDFYWELGSLEETLESCFSSLEASESLKELTIGRYCPDDDLDQEFVWAQEHIPPRLSKLTPERQDLPPGLEKIFIKIPKLQMLTLEGFQMGLAEQRSLVKTLDQRGILVCGLLNTTD